MSISEYFAAIDEIVQRFVLTDDFWSCEISIPQTELDRWICMRKNPKHFSTAMFLGQWSVEGKHPTVEPIRLVRLMPMPDDSLRIIGRQGDDLFVLMLENPKPLE